MRYTIVAGEAADYKSTNDMRSRATSSGEREGSELSKIASRLPVDAWKVEACHG